MPIRYPAACPLSARRGFPTQRKRRPHLDRRQPRMAPQPHPSQRKATRAQAHPRAAPPVPRDAARRQGAGGLWRAGLAYGFQNPAGPAATADGGEDAKARRPRTAYRSRGRGGRAGARSERPINCWIRTRKPLPAAIRRHLRSFPARFRAPRTQEPPIRKSYRKAAASSRTK